MLDADDRMLYDTVMPKERGTLGILEMMLQLAERQAMLSGEQLRGVLRLMIEHRVAVMDLLDRWRSLKEADHADPDRP